MRGKNKSERFGCTRPFQPKASRKDTRTASVRRRGERRRVSVKGGRRASVVNHGSDVTRRHRGATTKLFLFGVRLVGMRVYMIGTARSDGRRRKALKTFHRRHGRGSPRRGATKLICSGLGGQGDGHELGADTGHPTNIIVGM